MDSLQEIDTTFFDVTLDAVLTKTVPSISKPSIVTRVCLFHPDWFNNEVTFGTKVWT